MTETARRTTIRNSQMQSRSCIQKLVWLKLGPIKSHFWPVRASSCWIGSTSFLNTHSPIFFTHDFTTIKFLSKTHLIPFQPSSIIFPPSPKNTTTIYIYIQSTATTLTRHTSHLRRCHTSQLPSNLLFSHPQTHRAHHLPHHATPGPLSLATEPTFGTIKSCVDVHPRNSSALAVCAIGLGRLTNAAMQMSPSSLPLPMTPPLSHGLAH
jgi:hypothetical protein